MPLLSQHTRSARAEGRVMRRALEELGESCRCYVPLDMPAVRSMPAFGEKTADWGLMWPFSQIRRCVWGVCVTTQCFLEAQMYLEKGGHHYIYFFLGLFSPAVFVEKTHFLIANFVDSQLNS